MPLIEVRNLQKIYLAEDVKTEVLRGLYPARQAAAKNPIDALCYE